jgi:pimeloyl-ACP methyl ester carboxylesterase
MTAALRLSLLAGLLAPLSLPAQNGRLVAHEFRSRALAANLLGEPGIARFEVYAPRSYSLASERRYPSLYLLHGIVGTSADWTRPGYQGMTIQSLMDSLTAGGLPEMIVVVPTAMNSFGGSYYSNSPVTGNWEDFLSRELVAWVDSAYRTIPAAASRGITGHSMGGFGAILMSMRHPDVFGAAYAMAPCCLAGIADVGPDNEVWKRMHTFRDLAGLQQAAQGGDIYPMAVIGLSAVMTPNPARPPLFVDLPFRFENGSVRAVDPVLSLWRDRFLVAQVGRSRDMLLRLRAPLRMDYGFSDQFPHIPPGVRMFSDSLAAYQVPHRVDAYVGDHREHIRARMTSIVLPFFAATLRDRL